MTTLQIIILLVLIGLTSCNSADKSFGQVASKDTTSILQTTTSTTDSPRFILDTTIISSFQGDTAKQINKTLKFISDFDKISINFPQDTFSVYEKTTEGCEIIVTYDRSTEYVKFYGTLFGEMGKSEFSFYALNDKHPKLSCTIYHDISYDEPMYQKDIKIRETKTIYEIYCDNKIIAVLDGKKRRQNLSAQGLKSKEADTREFFKNYIGQIRIAK